MKHKIYLDNNATTLVDPCVCEAVMQDLKHHYGNPSSIHAFGQDSRSRLAASRHSIASFLNVRPNEIIFTSGGTEGINMVIRGIFEGKPGGHIVTSSVEHSCVYGTVKQLESLGCQATFLSPGLWGAVTEEAVREAIRPDTRLIVLMAVNNETGVKTDIERVAKVAQEARIPFLVDAVALLGKEPFVIPDGVSAMCFSGHKIHAPKGIGFAFIRSQLKLRPLLTGGDQEYGRRGGTENVSGIIGLTEAIRQLKVNLTDTSKQMEILRNKLEHSLLEQLVGVTVNGLGPRVVNTTNLSFSGVDGETLLAALDMEGIAVSHGSACASGALEPSRILLNMGLPTSVARSSIRFSLSRFTTESEIDICVRVVRETVMRLRRLAS